ncbi:olfactory receptor 14J1-like, partial [Apteryx mantelli]|uniref:Olfactory receptor 14J1-like n=1 Tax=Apteryx mantelli TaxID=2696672 RepID=A0ABM4G798_9AVES
FNDFLLLAFADTRELQLLHFSLFLGIYLTALLGNGLIITAVACDHHLHTPMYFFLLHLSVLDIGSISTTVPKSMANSLWNTRAISYSGCAAQVFLFVFLFTGEFSLLTVMAYDRYVAICRPLHYGTIMGSRACVRMAAAAWASGFLHSLVHTAHTFSIPLCQGNVVDQFFCEIPQILKLSCSDAYLRESRLLLFSACLFFGCFVFIVLSYVQIFTAVLRMPSEQGRHKAFSMCLPHLAVVSLFVSTVIFAYLKPPSISSPALDLVLAVLYTVVPPTVNPLIYSMRNKELKDALRKKLGVKSSLSISTTSQSPSSDHRSYMLCPTLSITLGTSELSESPREQMSNSSSLNEFLLQAFTDKWELQILHFLLFLGIYLAAILGNGLIVTAVAYDHCLHTPMYFFLLNLSLLDIGTISTTVPKSMSHSLWDTRVISYSGCAAQIFFVVFFVLAEYCLLTVMAYDRYIAICRPLHYGTIMNIRACAKMAAAAWVTVLKQEARLPPSSAEMGEPPSPLV